MIENDSTLENMEPFCNKSPGKIGGIGSINLLLPDAPPSKL